MHLRIFGKMIVNWYCSIDKWYKIFTVWSCLLELAKDYLQNDGHTVIGGIISPVHDQYGKKVTITQAAK